jgi:hypothetical protein
LYIQAVVGPDGFVDCHGHISLAWTISLIGEIELLNGLVAPGLPCTNLSKPVQIGSDQVAKKGLQFGQGKMALEGFFFRCPAINKSGEWYCQMI